MKFRRRTAASRWRAAEPGNLVRRVSLASVISLPDLVTYLSNPRLCAKDRIRLAVGVAVMVGPSLCPVGTGVITIVLPPRTAETTPTPTASQRNSRRIDLTSQRRINSTPCGGCPHYRRAHVSTARRTPTKLGPSALGVSASSKAE